MLSLPIAPAILDERSSLELCEGDPKLFLGIHHDGTVPGDGLADRLARDEQKPHTSNRATTSFTLVGHSADFTPSVVQLAFWGGRHLHVLAQTRD